MSTQKLNFFLLIQVSAQSVSQSVSHIYKTILINFQNLNNHKSNVDWKIIGSHSIIYYIQLHPVSPLDQAKI